MNEHVSAILSAAGQKQVPGWIVAWGFLGLLAIWSAARRRRLGRLAPTRLWLLAALVVFLFAGAIKGCITFSEKRSKETEAWPSTPGVVVRSELRSAGSGHRSRSKEYLHLRYRYTVNGVSHEGTDVTRDNARIGNADEEWALRYPVGTKVDVRYNPRNPNEAVLESFSAGNDTVSWPVQLFLFAMSLVLFGLWETLLHGASGPHGMGGSAE